MNKPLIFLLVVALVLAQGLRLCVHAPDASHGGIAQPSLVHYESDTGTDTGEAGIDFDVTYVLHGLDFHSLLTGMSAFTVLLFALLLMAAQLGRQLSVAHDATWRWSDSFRLRPPLRAPPL